jgi:hypothetical protein
MSGFALKVEYTSHLIVVYNARLALSNLSTEISEYQKAQAPE